MTRRLQFQEKHVEPIRNPDERAFKTATTRFQSLEPNTSYKVWTGSRFKPVDTGIIIHIKSIRYVALKDYTEEMLLRDIGHDSLGQFMVTLRDINGKYVDGNTELYYHEFKRIKTPTLSDF